MNPPEWHWDGVRQEYYYWNAKEQCYYFQNSGRVPAAPSGDHVQADSTTKGKSTHSANKSLKKEKTSHARRSSQSLDKDQDELSSRMDRIHLVDGQKDASFSGNYDGEESSTTPGIVVTGPREKIADSDLYDRGIQYSRPLRPSGQGGFDSNYRKQRNPTSFFKVGKVFKIYWAEPAGAAVAGATTVTGRWEKEIFAKPRWFVVIKIGHQSCTCLPIQTYQGKGTGKKSVIKSDHAIIYTGSTPPPIDEDEWPASNERGMREPIRVVQRNKRDKLDAMSRVNFAKVYTVEHYSEVYDFGEVHNNAMHLLVHQFYAVWDRDLHQRAASSRYQEPAQPTTAQSQLGSATSTYPYADIQTGDSSGFSISYPSAGPTANLGSVPEEYGISDRGTYEGVTLSYTGVSQMNNQQWSQLQETSTNSYNLSNQPGQLTTQSTAYPYGIQTSGGEQNISNTTPGYSYEIPPATSQSTPRSHVAQNQTYGYNYSTTTPGNPHESQPTTSQNTPRSHVVQNQTQDQNYYDYSGQSMPYHTTSYPNYRRRL